MQLLLWLVGCLKSQQHADVSQRRICSDKSSCCHFKIEVADQTFHLTQSQHTDTGPDSPGDIIMLIIIMMMMMMTIINNNNNDDDDDDNDDDNNNNNNSKKKKKKNDDDDDDDDFCNAFPC